MPATPCGSIADVRLSLWPLLIVPAPPLSAQDAAGTGLAERYCAECHTGADAERGFRIDAALADATGAGAEQALLRLRSRTMPPPDAAQPTAEERRRLAAHLAARVPVDPAAAAPTMRRLARVEYERTVRDLFGIDWRGGDLLPEDPRAYGFDNVGDVTGMTPLSFEKYAAAAAAIAALVLADPAATARAFGDGAPLATGLADLLDRAFRRPAHQAEIDARCELFASLRAAGHDETTARAAVLRSVLTSPSFLFRVEVDRPDGGLSGHELAVRLSYLLTGSSPDAALRQRAARGELHDRAVLTAEARRLVAATGGRQLAERFAAQWLRLQDVLTHNADFRRYPEIWNHALRPAFHEEAVRFFAALAAGDERVLLLLDADFTFANDTLRRHYGLPGDGGGDEWQRVPLPDRRRGGVLGMGAMLFVSSYPLRTSPVLRGKWVLDHLLDTPPPPPPPGAGTLPADDRQPDELTLRQRLERHRQQKSCADCHAQIDPIGFALENYDVLGRWRDAVHGQAVDARAELPDGTALDGPAALKDALLLRQDDFVRAMAKALLVFGTGRPTAVADEAELQRIVGASAAGDHRFGPLLDAVITSPLFTSRRLAPEKRP